MSDLPLDAGVLAVSRDGRLVVSMEVHPGSTPRQSRGRADREDEGRRRGPNARLYDRLFVRHWDTWKDGTRNHLFAYDVASGMAKDLMPALDADCPTKPFGGSEDYTVSPDRRTVVFAARDAGREEAWSTNFDLYAVPVDGSAAPRKITANPAWDAQPRFSPDGTRLAYLAMRVRPDRCGCSSGVGFCRADDDTHDVPPAAQA